MIDTLLETVKKQRLAWSWAVIVGLFLVLVGHAPVIPVITGCVLALGVAVLRSWPRVSAKAAVRGTR